MATRLLSIENQLTVKAYKMWPHSRVQLGLQCWCGHAGVIWEQPVGGAAGVAFIPCGGFVYFIQKNPRVVETSARHFGRQMIECKVAVPAAWPAADTQAAWPLTWWRRRPVCRGLITVILFLIYLLFWYSLYLSYSFLSQFSLTRTIKNIYNS